MMNIIHRARSQSALFIQFAYDRVVAIEDSLAGAAAWPGARHLSVEQRGHRRLLADPVMVAAAITFTAISH